MSLYAVDKLISQARHLAADYRRATGKSLPISGEIAVHDACSLLGLVPCDVPAAGYDAMGQGVREGRRIQIKGRAIFDERKGGQRIGQLKLEQEWDSVMLVLMNADFETEEIYEAERDTILHALDESSGSTRKKRGALSVSRFKRIAHLVWQLQEGEVRDEIWDNQVNVP
ncbi:MAG: hypothetical protein R6X06_10815 [Gammaproteobacteria bacterium]